MERGRAAYANQPHQPMKNPKQSRPAFTLIEMLVTITIIVILAGLSLGGFKFVTTKQANSQAAIQIKLLEKGIEEYKLDNGVYPPQGNNELYKALYWDSDNDGVGATKPDGSPLDEDQKIYLADLDAANNKQGWTQGKDASVTIIDPWAKEYIYRNPGTVNPDFDLLSNGQDGATDNNGPKSKDDHSNY